MNAPLRTLFSISSPRPRPVALLLAALIALAATAGPVRADDVPAGLEAHAQIAPERAGSVIIGVAAHLGVADRFELYRDDDDGNRQEVELFAAPTGGFALELDYKLSDLFALGLESLFLWVEHEEDGDRRLMVTPHARARLAFALGRSVAVEAALGLGMAWWQEDEESGNRELDAIAQSRLGLSLRMAVGASWALSELVATTASVGYTTSLTGGDGDEAYTARFGTVLFGLGVRLGL